MEYTLSRGHRRTGFRWFTSQCRIEYYDIDATARDGIIREKIPPSDVERTFVGPNKTFYFFRANGGGKYHNGVYARSFAPGMLPWFPEPWEEDDDDSTS